MRKAWIALGLALTFACAGMWLLGRAPATVERCYVDAIGPRLQGLVAAVSGALPGVSLAEWIEVAAIAGALGWLALLGRWLWRPPARGRAWVLVDAALQVWVALAAVGLLFYALWGLAYARPPAEERFGWTRDGAPLPPIDAAELAAHADALVDEANALYLDLHGWPDDLRDTRVRGAGPEDAPDRGRRALARVDRAVDLGYVRMVEAEKLHETVALGRGPAKPLVTSIVFAYLGIGGFYFPFTAEANIQLGPPEWTMPHTVAHEKAHQRFAASENEANFYGFLACVYAEDTLLRYGGTMFAQRQVLSALRRVDPMAFRRIIARRYPGVQRDVNASHDYWQRFQGPANTFGDMVNDRYLRLNGVEGGVESYSRSVTLVVEWLRHHPR